MDVVFNLAHAPAAGAHAVQGRRLRRRQGCSAQPCRPARRSPPALAKDATKYTPGGQPVHSLATLLDDLATIAANRIQPAAGLPGFTTPDEVYLGTPPPDGPVSVVATDVLSIGS